MFKNTVYTIIYIIVNLVIVFGFVLPYLISAKNDLAVIAGIGLGIVDAVHLLFLVRRTLKRS